MSTEIHVLTNWYNGHRLVRYVSIIEPIPAKAIRIRTSDGQPPVKTQYTKYDRYVKVDGYDDVYDVFTDSTSWDNILVLCSNLQEVLGSNPTGITSCYAPFGASSLVTVSGFDIGTVAAQRIFDQCSNLISVALFDTSSITDGTSMFDTCSSLISVPLFDFSNVTNTQNMFRDCAALSYIPAFLLPSVSNCRDMFNGCRNVQSGALAVYNQLVETVTTPFMYAGTFNNCGIDTVTGAAELDQIPTDWGGTKTPQPAYTLRLRFKNGVTPTNPKSDGTLTQVSTSPNVWDWTYNNADCAGAWQGYTTLLEVIDGNTSNVTNMYSMFNYCTSLTAVPLLDTSNVTNMSNMFKNCYKVESGALALYRQASSQTTPPSSHSGTFTNCGRDTTTGAAELAQIPASWK